MESDSKPDRGITEPVTLDDIRAHARLLHAEKGWRERSPNERALYLMSEVGELAKALIALSDDTARVPDNVEDAIADELLDIVWNVCALANTLQLDLNTAAHRKLASMRDRKWD
jgi:NTP pyrophosphatase (non-canonical NTP hydrolase)